MYTFFAKIIATFSLGLATALTALTLGTTTAATTTPPVNPTPDQIVSSATPEQISNSLHAEITDLRNQIEKDKILTILSLEHLPLLGEKSNSVKELQVLLSNINLLSVGSVTGYFGSDTTQAINNFQIYYQLPTTSVLDAQTLDQIIDTAVVRENLASIYFPEENQLLGIATSSEATINILNDSLNMVSADVGSYPTTIVYDTPLVSCGTSGSAQQTASVTLLPATQTIMSGNSATLTWNGTNVSSCSATSPAGWMSSTAIAGSKSVSPTASATTTLTYSLTCTSKVGGTNPSASATVTITPKH